MSRPVWFWFLSLHVGATEGLSARGSIGMCELIVVEGVLLVVMQVGIVSSPDVSTPSVVLLLVILLLLMLLWLWYLRCSVGGSTSVVFVEVVLTLLLLLLSVC